MAWRAVIATEYAHGRVTHVRSNGRGKVKVIRWNSSRELAERIIASLQKLLCGKKPNDSCHLKQELTSLLKGSQGSYNIAV
jgi:hypothetical protein